MPACCRVERCSGSSIDPNSHWDLRSDAALSALCRSESVLPAFMESGQPVHSLEAEELPAASFRPTWLVRPQFSVFR